MFVLQGEVHKSKRKHDSHKEVALTIGPKRIGSMESKTWLYFKTACEQDGKMKDCLNQYELIT